MTTAEVVIKCSDFASMLYLTVFSKGLASAATLNLRSVNHTFTPSQYAREIAFE